MDKSVVLIGGFAGSGSSAVMDLLKEIEGYSYVDAELRFVVDHDGIISLDSALVDNWTPYQSDVAIKRFRDLIGNLTIKNSQPYCGVDLSQCFNGKLIEFSEEYLSQLVGFKYKGMWLGVNNYLFKAGYKLNQILGKNIFQFHKNIKVSNPSVDFKALTANFTRKLLNEHDPNAKSYIVDEPFCSLNPKRVMRYFDNSKVINVYRDPRDIFVNAQKYRYEFIPRDVVKFVEWYSFLMEKASHSSNESENVLRIQFEDLVSDYESTKSKVFSFLNLKDQEHQNKFRYLKPEASLKNVGLFKTYENTNEITYIKEKLPTYCVVM
jgi:sulfotransferase family protein